jgi:hypothetical protein
MSSLRYICTIFKFQITSSVVDPQHFDADPDSTYHPVADPDSVFLFVADPDSVFLFVADPDPTFHPDADSDPDPSFKKGSTS